MLGEPSGSFCRTPHTTPEPEAANGKLIAALVTTSHDMIPEIVSLPSTLPCKHLLKLKLSQDVDNHWTRWTNGLIK